MAQTLLVILFAVVALATNERGKRVPLTDFVYIGHIFYNTRSGYFVNVVSNNNLTLKDLNINPSDVEEAMKKWLWRYKDGGQFAKA